MCWVEADGHNYHDRQKDAEDDVNDPPRFPSILYRWRFDVFLACIESVWNDIGANVASRQGCRVRD